MRTKSIDETDISSSSDLEFFHESRASQEMFDEHEDRGSHKRRRIHDELDLKDRENLAKWAARLELESITLKESIKNDMNSIISDQTKKMQTSYKSMATTVAKLEKSVKVLVESDKKRQTTEDADNDVAGSKTRTRNRSKDQFFIQDSVLDHVSLLSKGFESLKDKHIELKSSIESLDQRFVSGIRELKIIKPLESTENEETTTNDIAQIKEFLKLLLPKVIRLDESFQKLSIDFQILTLKNKQLDTPTKSMDNW